MKTMRFLVSVLVLTAAMFLNVTLAQASGFIVYRDNGGDIWLMNDDGTNKHNITNTPGTFEDSPSSSKDGSKIAYTSLSGSSYSLVTMNADGSNRSVIYTSPYSDGFNFTEWAPDGNSLLFRQGPYNSYDIWSINADGTNAHNITNDGMHNGSSSYSPDGSQIVYDRRSIPSYSYSVEVWKMNADGTGKTQLTFGGWSGYSSENGSPDWSPDGTRIAYDSGAYGFTIGNNMYPHDIWLMNPDGSNKVRITTDSAWEQQAAWSADGSQIVFTRGSNLWKMNADGSGQVQLTFDGGSAADWAQPVPEPATMLLLGSGLVGLAGFKRRFSGGPRSVVASKTGRDGARPSN